jgi:hypothetical protein
MSSKLRTTSWILLTVLGALVLLGSVVSAGIAYGHTEYPIGTTPLTDVAAGREAVATALRAVRGTSAAYAASYAVLFLFIVTGPYRRGEVWAWWALLVAGVAMGLIGVARVPFLGVPMGQLGSGPAFIQMAVIIVALLLDVKRLSAKG